MKIGLFGGTFDPPHIGHIELAASLLEQTGLDKIWFLVTPQNPWKQGRALSSDHHRYAMVDISLREKPGLEASDYEFGMPKPTYTYKTLRSLRSSFPDVTFALIIGGDNWASFDKWAEYEEILHNHPVIVYPRPGCPVETPEAVRQIIAENSAPDTILPHIEIAEGKVYDISSTEIRHKVAQGASINGLVMPGVETYINDYALYAETKQHKV